MTRENGAEHELKGGTRPLMAVVMKSRRRYAAQSRFLRIGLVLAGLSLVALSILVAVRLQQGPVEKKSEGASHQKLTVGQAEGLKRQKNYGEAASAAQARFDDTQDPREKYLAALQTASIYETKKDYASAVTWYLKAESLTPNQWASLGGLGRSYEALGDKEKAADYYRRSLRVIDRTIIGSENDVAYYESLLKRVTGEKR